MIYLLFIIIIPNYLKCCFFMFLGHQHGFIIILYIQKNQVSHPSEFIHNFKNSGPYNKIRSNQFGQCPHWGTFLFVIFSDEEAASCVNRIYI
jgi:hypothetical protein